MEPLAATINPRRYSLASITLHWLMLLIIAGTYAAVELHEGFPRGSAPRAVLMNWHFTLGLSVFALVWLRILARLVWPAPMPVAGAPPWRHAASAAMHLALYLLMIGMPIAGWWILSAEGKAIPFFGLELPPLAGRNEELAERIEELHELGGMIGYFLIGLHAVAALFHHYVLRDRAMSRMFPLRA